MTRYKSNTDTLPAAITQKGDKGIRTLETIPRLLP